MSHYKNTALDSDYTVFVAFTIVYNDIQGKLLFCIEVGDDPKTIFLNPNPSDGDQMVKVSYEATKIRVDLAIERIKTYFNEQGLNVESE